MNNELFYTFIFAILAMIFGYSMSLDRRTLKLEKKNGHEQDQINKLKEELTQTRQELTEQKEINLKLVAKVNELEKKLEKYERSP